ncbi:SDR family oxidoreductase [Acetobacteraceae bacterium KSS8]|uniref:SDR family oxidoreductase n=1 Tax=Endosaccharibacter trunci TaxID=2812733 RepID=A0ABT1W9Z8_9PROT|nr:SDR family oxidoreductase [Acetobacteraceae bacterium KSS8]
MQTPIAIVTGGSRGIGRDTVLQLAAQGVRTILTFNSNQDAAEEVTRLAADSGAPSAALQWDASRTDGFVAFAERVGEVLAGWDADRFDYLVNNAGTASSATLADVTEAELDAMFAIHVKAPLLLTQTLLPLMRDGGRIVNLSSGLARFCYPGRIAYGPMKAAVDSLTRYMALELGPRRIAVNAVAPGAIATDFSGGMVRDRPEINEAIARQTALGRVGLPGDVGPVIAAVLSGAMGWVNGQRIEVAGGVHL